MRWDRSHESSNVEDRRGEGVPLAGGGMGGLGLLLPLAMRFGWKGILVAVVLFVALRGVDCGSQAPTQQAMRPAQVESGQQDELIKFVGFVFDDVQSAFARQLADRGYRETKLVVFSRAVQSGCGIADAAVGPFYCPLDRKVYIDLSFYRELQRRFGAPGDFAQAYVIAHEVGHHVQNVLGVLESRGNEGSVQVELQADCLAGVWAHSVYARGDLEAGDIEEGLAAAEGVGDDRIQEQAGMDVNPETWTHGSSEQRQEWFDKGFDSGRSDDCDTFA
jgi:predicted metalloprotease